MSTIAVATSAGCRNVPAAINWRASPAWSMSATICVLVPSGQIVWTRILSFLSSAAREVPRDSAAALVAAYTLRPGTGPCALSEAVMAMSPPFTPWAACARNTLVAAREPHRTARKLTSTRVRIWLLLRSDRVPSKPTPALHTQAPSGAYVHALAAIVKVASSSVTSRASPSAAPISLAVRSAATASRSVTMTSYPRATSSTAMARPMPRAAPVTTAERGFFGEERVFDMRPTYWLATTTRHRTYV